MTPTHFPVGLGTWQLGADWGEVSESDAHEVLSAATETATLLDTADVYGDGLSERRIAAFLAEHGGTDITVATKMGRRVPQEPENYTPENFRAWTDRSRTNLRSDTLDLVQLHCPPTAVLESLATYDALEALKADGAIAAYGASVETCGQALTAIERGVASIQIILNPLRLKPLEEVLPAAQEAGVTVLARVPLASGLLSGRYNAQTTFAANDHRTFNRHGEAFDQGETFSGVDFAVGLEAVPRLTQALPDGVDLPTASLAWIITRPGVTAVIPGARNAEQARANARAAQVAASTDLSAFEDAVTETYDALLRREIHDRW